MVEVVVALFVVALILDVVVDWAHAAISTIAVKLVASRVHFFDFIPFSSPSYDIARQSTEDF